MQYKDKVRFIIEALGPADIEEVEITVSSPEFKQEKVFEYFSEDIDED